MAEGSTGKMAEKGSCTPQNLYRNTKNIPTTEEAMAPAFVPHFKNKPPTNITSLPAHRKV